ncbi:hypothetical protein SNE26_15730 [Mucilaginibacter sp. cycad4]|uniref:hypothetical protein n=1 Tax=Mucilaginibacter sp. cycad4 TaxID=3342096 RepID=UPI002AAA7481|nr:hypothetical protein [Mucilaginibacter gossypii]WPU97476.1 hypothetical protein SNE26_15730 [Mucilaginibacter gossypii]
MGNKIITEKDFFQCSGGMMPSPFQSTQLIVKKKTGDKYITLNDTSTVSWVDFGCKKLMLLYAVIAAIAVVAVALIVGTGGLALVAVGAAAGAIGAVMGAIDGSAICGQKVSPVRKWLGSNANFQILGINTITGDHKMQCNAFNMLGMSSEFITFNPDIKNWSQAIAMGSASFAANVLQGAMTGMMIGGAAVAIPAMATGGTAALAEGGGMGLARYLGGNVAKNYLASWFTAEGLGLRGIMGVQSGLDAYGQTGSVSSDDVGHGITGMETGTVASAKNVATGQGNILDVLGLALWFTPAGELIKGREAKTEKAPNENRGGNGEKEKNGSKEEETARPANHEEVNEPQQPTGPEEAYQADGGGPRYGERRITDERYKKLRRQTPSQEIRDMVNEEVQLPMPDFALPGLEITKSLHADHIVSMDNITSMEGFDKLTDPQQLAVLNNKDNFIGLSETANTSKGSKSYEEWTRYKKGDIDVDPDFRNEMMQREQETAPKLQKQIDDFVSENERNSAGGGQ